MGDGAKARARSQEVPMNDRWRPTIAALALVACSTTSHVAARVGVSSDGGQPAPPPAMGGESEASGLTDIGAVVAPTTAGPSTKLPPLPALTNVVATQREDSVGIDFDPVDGAVDYRVYPLPTDQDITIHSDGTTTVAKAIYRCAGLRQTYDLASNLNASDRGLLFADQYTWRAQVPANPLLGYVYVTLADGRAPVYAIAGHPSDDEHGWRESRFKIYTVDSANRKALLRQGWRDDGIAFYVPRVTGPGTRTIYSSLVSEVVAGQGWTQSAQYYFGEADLDGHSKDTIAPAPAFQVLTTPARGTQPLMAVFYQAQQRHTELSAGKERFKRAALQGPGPLWHLEWSGITRPTTLVVEALASGCPFQGFLSPQHLQAPPHQTLYTLAELQAAAPGGQVFVNGQYDTKVLPKAVARSFVAVAPQPHDPGDWDWYQGFGVDTDFGPVSQLTKCTEVGCRAKTPIFDISAYSLDAPNNAVLTYGQFLGQLWVAFDDTGSDVTGKVRFTALRMADVDSNPAKFLHVTMAVDIMSTDRRYPQMIISDQKAPVQEGMSNPNHNTLLVQPIEGPSMRIEAQAIHGLVNGQSWDVNNQAPEHRFIDYDNNVGNDGRPSPAEPPFEHAGMDRLTRFDVYVSSQRTYVFFDGAPAGCMQYPSAFRLKGPVTVTFGDVIYHEGAEDERICAGPKPYPFMHAHQCTETKRHFDDLGFKSGVAAPKWNEAKLPCGPY
jgi:hypothetical protein